jgi:DNA modification methylase
MAGTGKIAKIREFGFKGHIICNDLEPDWADLKYEVNEWYISDAEEMVWCKDESIDAICTSPAYGNRMADHFHSKDKSRRITYYHSLGRDLDERNTGRLQWGDKYRDAHTLLYREFWRVLKPGGLFVLNVSDHIRNGERIPVTAWHQKVCLTLGFKYVNRFRVMTPRMRFGANHNKRVRYENIIVFEK